MCASCQESDIWHNEGLSKGEIMSIKGGISIKASVMEKVKIKKSPSYAGEMSLGEIFHDKMRPSMSVKISIARACVIAITMAGIEHFTPSSR